jgi:hypothetical protein
VRRTGRSDGGRDDRTPGAWTEERRVRSLTLFEGRASTSVLGFTLMFSITMTTFALYQADVVPHQNEQVEYQHNQGMDAELRKLGGRMHQATVEGAETSVTLDTAPEYPSRAVARNPPPPDGTIRTTTTGTVALTGFHSRTTLQPYWDGSERRFDTRMLAYEPRYNKIEGASYWVEQGVVAKRYANGQSRVVRGQVVSGRTISLTLLSGDIERTGDSSTVRFRPVSTTTERLTVTPGSAPTVTLPTRLSESHWKDRAEESTTIESVDHRGDEVELALADDIDPSDGDTEPYSLRLTKVTVDGPAEVSDPSTDAEYLTVSGSSVTREADGTVSLSGTTGTTTTVTFRTRDRFGNPTPATVGLSTGDDTLDALLPDEVGTGPDGAATVRVTPSTTLDASFTAAVPNVDGGPDEPYRELSVDVAATSNDPSTILPEPVYTGGQMFDDLGGASTLELSEGRTVPASDEDCVLIGDTGGLVGDIADTNCDSESFRTLQGSLSLEKKNDNRLQVRYYVFDENGDRRINDDDGATIRIRNDDGERVFEGELKRDATKKLLDDRGTDIFDENSYATTAWSADAGGDDDDVFEGGPFDGVFDDGNWADRSYDSFDDLGAHKVESLFVEEATGRVTVDTD